MPNDPMPNVVCLHYQRVQAQCCAWRQGGCGGPLFMRALITETDGATDTSFAVLCEAHAKSETAQFDHEGTSYKRRDEGDDGWSVVPIPISATPD